VLERKGFRGPGHLVSGADWMLGTTRAVEFNVVTRNAVIGSREECCIREKLAEQP